MCQIFGCRHADLVKQPPSSGPVFFDMIHPLDRPTCSLEAVLQAKRLQLDVRLVCDGSRTTWVAVNIVPTKSPSAGFILVVKVNLVLRMLVRAIAFFTRRMYRNARLQKERQRKPCKPAAVLW